MRETKLHIEGWLFIPPKEFIKNPLITTINGKIISIETNNAPPFTHKGCLMPSLVNAHAHLDFSKPVYAQDFISWVKKIIQKENKTRGYSKHTFELLKSCIKLGILRTFDITKILDYPLTQFGCIPFYEITGDKNTPVPEIPQNFMISIHSPYSVSPELMKKIREKYKDRAFAIHLAETDEELKFLKRERNRIEDEIYPLVGRTPTERKVYNSPLEPLAEAKLLTPKTFLIHCIYLNEQEIEKIAESKSSVVICPRSNLYLSGSIAPLNILLQKGVNVCIGTDSLASSPNLNIWEEARLLFLLFKIPPDKILEMLTISPLKSIGKTIPGLILFETSKNKEEIPFEILFQGENLITTIFSLQLRL